MTYPQKLKKKKEHSYMELCWFILRNLKPREGYLFLFSFVALVAGIVSLILTFNTISLILLPPGFLGIIVRLISLYRILFSMPQAQLEGDLKILNEISTILPSIDEEKHGYKTFTVSGCGTQVVRSAKIDQLLRSNKISLVEDPTAVSKILSELRASANQMEELLRCQFRNSMHAVPPKHFRNESKLCIASDILAESREIKIYHGSYFISFLTNEVCTQRLVTLTEFPTSKFEGRSMFPLTHDFRGKLRLKSISQSLMGNHIGISTIGYSKDKKLCFWRQSTKALKSERLLAPTGSGSCDWKDLPSSRLLEDLLINAMEREFHEESNRRGSSITIDQVTQTKLLGFFRWVSRGGKPEFVGVSKLNVIADALCPNVDEVDAPRDLDYFLTYPAATYHELLSSIAKLLKRNDLSVPLWVNLVVLNEALREEQEMWEKFFGLKT